MADLPGLWIALGGLAVWALILGLAKLFASMPGESELEQEQQVIWQHTGRLL